VYRFSSANQDSHDSEDAAEDEEAGKADAEGVEDPEKMKIWLMFEVGRLILVWQRDDQWVFPVWFTL
jgi:hypothetical protein